jgi:hypothetical protein
MQRLRQNCDTVQQRIAAAAARAGRMPDAVRLVAVTKYVGDDVVQGMLELGLRDLGENRVQQLLPRARELGFAPQTLAQPAPREPRAVWHMIGHLQRNKVRALLGCVRIVHSVDSLRLAEEIEAEAARLAQPVDILLEVNASGEDSKYGLSPSDVAPIAAAASKLAQVRMCGLMTMAPISDNAEDSRPHFARTRELLEELRRCGDVPPGCVQLSMGMSQDFEVAVEEGATLVRIGSTLIEGLS